CRRLFGGVASITPLNATGDDYQQANSKSPENQRVETSIHMVGRRDVIPEHGEGSVGGRCARSRLLCFWRRPPTPIPRHARDDMIISVRSASRNHGDSDTDQVELPGG